VSEGNHLHVTNSVIASKINIWSGVGCRPSVYYVADLHLLDCILLLFLKYTTAPVQTPVSFPWALLSEFKISARFEICLHALITGMRHMRGVGRCERLSHHCQLLPPARATTSGSCQVIIVSGVWCYPIVVACTLPPSLLPLLLFPCGTTTCLPHSPFSPFSSSSFSAKVSIFEPPTSDARKSSVSASLLSQAKSLNIRLAFTTFDGGDRGL
jgi:hypothetical protein